MAAHGITPEKATPTIVAFLKNADANAGNPSARKGALQGAAAAMANAVAVLNKKRKGLKKNDTAQAAAELAQEHAAEIEQEAKACQDAITGLTPMAKALVADGKNLELLGPFGRVEKETGILLDSKLLMPLMDADHEDAMIRSKARNDAKTLLAAELKRLIDLRNQKTAEAKEALSQKSIDEYKAQLDEKMSDKRSDVSALATEYRKWKSQLTEAAAQL
jgi:hypothetical protein